MSDTNDGNRWLISMWTDPARRAQGVGHALVETVLAFARRVGSPELMLEVTHGNDSAFALYRACGFTETGSGVPHSDGEPTRHMRLAL